MIVELLSIAAVFVGGTALVRVTGIRGWPLPFLGFLAGICLQLTIGFVQVVSQLPTTPVLTLAATAALPVALWLVWWRRGHDVAVSVRWTAVTLAGLAAAVVLLRAAHLAKWHTDTLEYTMSGALIADGIFTSAASTQQMVTRLLGLPLLHAPANLAGDYYLHSVTALMAAATVATLVWFLRRGLRGADPVLVTAFTALGALLLLTNNRFIFSFFYLNGHLLFAMQVLLIVGCGWLLVRADLTPAAGGRAGGAASPDRVPAAALMVLPVLAIPALVVTRPEGFLMAGLALLPTLLSARVPLRHRMTLLMVLGCSIIGWYGYLAWVFEDRGAGVATDVSRPLLIGVMCLLAAPLLRAGFVGRHATRLLWLAEAGLWLLVIAAVTVRGPDILVDSIDATIQNAVFGEGVWGLSLVVLGLLLVAVLPFARAPDKIFLRFPVTTFLPVVVLLAYLRGTAYRVGYADSLSRMWIQILPVLVLFLVAAIVGSRRAKPRDPATEPAPAEGGDSLDRAAARSG